MKKKKPDHILLLVTGMIIFLGLFVLASAASVGSDVRFLQQVLLGFVPGAFIAFILFKTPLSVIQKWAPYALLLNIFFLLLTFVPFLSVAARGATRWVSLGPISFQPTEFLKLTFILYLASWLINKTKTGRRKVSMPFKETLLPFLVVALLVGGMLVLQPDISTLVIILFTACVVYFSAKTPLWHSFVILFSGLASFALLIRLAPYRLSRIISMFNPDLDPLGGTYQLRQILIAVGSGGILGRGIGMSVQKFGFVPLPSTDSIFAILAEETGFLGSILLLTLFFIFFYRGFLIAKNNTSGFARLATLGICFWIFIQTSINIGVMVGLLPVTGIPLPLISYGKSHLIAELAAIGLLLNMSQYTRK